MKRLSSPIAKLKSKKYDIVVIGSGYGGAITASRMARAGKSVCLLERGKEFQPGEYPNTFSQSSHETQLNLPGSHVGQKTGLFDINVNKDINVVKGCGLGGTSLINANVGMEPGPDIFKNGSWPKALLSDKQNLDEGYKQANRMLRTTPLPVTIKRPLPDKAKAMKTGAEKMGVESKWGLTPVYVNFDIDGLNHVGVKQIPCNGCGDCCSGCNYHAKNTMIMNYLPDTKNHGAEIFTQVNVRFISKDGDNWNVHYNLLTTGDEEFDAPTDFISADIVVVAAGTLGSTEILLRSKQEGLLCSDRLGHKFSGNGDFLAFGYNNDVAGNAVGFGTKKPPFDNPVGTNITSIIDLRSESPGMVIEEGVVPGALGEAFAAIVSVAAKLEGHRDPDKGLGNWLKKKFREVVSLFRGPHHGAIHNTLTYLVMTQDDGNGTMKLEDDRLRIDWPNAGKQPVFEIVSKKLKTLTDGLGGIYTQDPVWTKAFSKQLVTVHPLGGCVMGEDASNGVVNHKGQVFDGNENESVYVGLYVSDGSIVPCPLSINPSLTISALAERNCMYMAKDRGWTFNYEFASPDLVKPGN